MIMGDIELIREALENASDSWQVGCSNVREGAEKALEALTRIEQESKTNAE